MLTVNLWNRTLVSQALNVAFNGKTRTSLLDKSNSSAVSTVRYHVIRKELDGPLG